MVNRIQWTWVIAVGLLAASATSAQEPRFEITAMGGATYSEGVTRVPVTVPDVGTFDAVDPKSGASWGIRAAYLVDENVEVGVLFDQQLSRVEISGSRTLELGDMSISNIHAYGAYNFLDPDARVRPYLLLGLGATLYGSLDVNTEDYRKTIDGESKLSPTFGAGAKMFLNPRIGVRIEGRYTPTYIRSDPVGWYGDPYWGYYVVEEAQYSNQLEVAGGLTYRF
jgi:outer membrane protein W